MYVTNTLPIEKTEKMKTSMNFSVENDDRKERKKRKMLIQNKCGSQQ